ncbi:MAG TPA: threonine/serine exporter family protein [Actinomycetales bacterium]
MTDSGGADRDRRRLLAFLGVAMVATGQPVHEVEDELREVGRRLGVPDVQVAAGPTGVHVGLASGEPATFESVDGRLRLDQAVDVRLIRHLLVTGRIDVEQALERLGGLRGKPLRYPTWLAEGGFVAVAVGICLILQPGVANLAAAALGGAIVTGLTRAAGLHASLMALLPTVAAFAVSALVFAAAAAGLLDGALRTVLPPLAVLLPGALMVTGLSELAAGAMVAGSSRLMYGTVQLLLFALGIAAAAALLGTPAELLGNLRVAELGWWAAPLGLVVIGAGITLMEGVPLRLTPWVLGVLVVTFLVQLAGQRLGAPVLGSFLGAMAASIGASTAELVQRRLPRLVVFLPSFWLLVPGSLGLIGVSEVAILPGEAATVGFDVVGVILAIAMGLLVGSVVSRALRALVGRLRRTSR